MNFGQSVIHVYWSMGDQLQSSSMTWQKNIVIFHVRIVRYFFWFYLPLSLSLWYSAYFWKLAAAVALFFLWFNLRHKVDRRVCPLKRLNEPSSRYETRGWRWSWSWSFALLWALCRRADTISAKWHEQPLQCIPSPASYMSLQFMTYKRFGLPVPIPVHAFWFNRSGRRL